MGWDRLANGELIDRAERQGYEVLVTTDQSMRHQQNLTGRRLGIIVLLSTKWPDVQLRIAEIRAAIDGITARRIEGSPHHARPPLDLPDSLGEAHYGFAMLYA